jgi:hypothetical protein
MIEAASRGTNSTGVAWADRGARPRAIAVAMNHERDELHGVLRVDRMGGWSEGDQVKELERIAGISHFRRRKG